MMRFIIIIFLIAVFGFACVKPKTKNPVPVIEFTELGHAQKSEFTNKDTAVLTISYEDGDGDLLLDNVAEGPNIIFTPYFYNSTTNKFEIAVNPVIPTDTIRILASITQPDNGYYKGKSIKGNIYIPMSEFRPSDSYKIVKFTGFAIDVKKHQSNIVTSPVYTLNF